MAIDLSNVPAEAREALRAQIKADKQDAVEKRLAKIKVDEETQAKLDRLAELEDKETKAKAAVAKTEAVKTADTYLTENKVTDLDSFKELKAYDEFMALDDEDKKSEFLKNLQEKKPNLFKAKGKKASVLDLTGATLSSGKDKTEELKVY